AETRLYHNSCAKPGLRIRLKGPPGNPTGVGAQMRLQSGPWKGPVREVHGGSGYWSQDSAVQVLASPGTPTQIWVRWPGGKSGLGALLDISFHLTPVTAVVTHLLALSANRQQAA